MKANSVSWSRAQDRAEQIVEQLTMTGVEFYRYEGLVHDRLGITARAGGGRIAWFHDPDGKGGGGHTKPISQWHAPRGVGPFHATS